MSPRPDVAVRVARGDVTEALCEHAEGAALVVVGRPASADTGLPTRLSARISAPVFMVDEDGCARSAHGLPQEVSSAARCVRDVMSSPAVTVDVDAPVSSVVRELDRHAITCLPVIDAEGRLTGVIGEADVVAHLGGEADLDALAHVRVRDLMCRDVWSVDPDDSLVSVATLFASSRLNSVPVLLHDRVAGVVSRHDLVRTAR
jgi:CBS domain-containing protein